jgi:hypothetical protein
LVEFYQHGVNAYVVKPVTFAEFTTAVEQVGLFWTVINEAPPITVAKEAATISAAPASAGRAAEPEPPAPNPEVGG